MDQSVNFVGETFIFASKPATSFSLKSSHLSELVNFEAH